MSPEQLTEYEEILKRLKSDLTELESVSSHLENVKEYAQILSSSDKKVTETLSQIHTHVQSLVFKFENTSQETINKISESLALINIRIQETLSGLEDATVKFKSDFSTSAERLEAVLGRMTELDFPTLFNQVRDDIASVNRNSEDLVVKSRETQKVVDETQKTSESIQNKVEFFDTRLKDLDRSVTLLQAEIGSLVNTLGTEVEQEMSQHAQKTSDQFDLITKQQEELEAKLQRSATLLQTELGSLVNAMGTEVQQKMSQHAKNTLDRFDQITKQQEELEAKLHEKIDQNYQEHTQIQLNLQKAILFNRYLNLALIGGVVLGLLFSIYK